MKRRFYAGIGPRATPGLILPRMSRIAHELRKRGMWLRSGGARGADSAFELPAGRQKEIFLADDCTEEAMALASDYHPAWDRCDEYARALHGRNAMIMLGPKLDDPVEFVVTWMDDHRWPGGTGLSLRIADAHDIRIFNIYETEGERELIQYMRDHPSA